MLSSVGLLDVKACKEEEGNKVLIGLGLTLDGATPKWAGNRIHSGPSSGPGNPSEGSLEEPADRP